MATISVTSSHLMPIRSAFFVCRSQCTFITIPDCWRRWN